MEFAHIFYCNVESLLKMAGMEIYHPLNCVALVSHALFCSEIRAQD